MPAKNYNRNARFQLRLDPKTLAALKARALRRGVPLNHYIADVLDTHSDDEAAYHQKMASKHSFMAYAMINVLAATLIPAESRKDVMRTIGDQADKLFGVNPAIPDAIGRRMVPGDASYVSELFLLFARHASRH